MSMKIATWNVNSIQSRLGHVKNWLSQTQPDILMLQELKGLEFPEMEFQALDYKSYYKGQKAYNGVAILYKGEAHFITDRLAGDPSDEQARYLEIEYKGLRLICLYLPNGNPVGTDKFFYKIKWMERLFERLQELRVERVPFLVGGDFNIIPEDGDCHDPVAWQGDALFHPKSLKQWQKLLNLGLYDSFRILNKNKGEYSFWDYQAGAWPKNNGIRIDHFLTSPSLADRTLCCEIDKTPRGWDKASDHTPVILTLSP